MLKKAWRAMRCRSRHGVACPHTTAYHQTPRERERARAQVRQLSTADPRTTVSSQHV